MQVKGSPKLGSLECMATLGPWSGSPHRVTKETFLFPSLSLLLAFIQLCPILEGKWFAFPEVSTLAFSSVRISQTTLISSVQHKVGRKLWSYFFPAEICQQFKIHLQT
jgi:hypothetical protein